MTEAPCPPLAVRLARGLDRHRVAVLVASLLATIGGAWVAVRLPVYGDLSHLLPPSATSVRHLRLIEKRARSLGVLMVAVESADPALRDRTARRLAERIRTLDTKLVASVTVDDAIERRFGWDHRFLFASLDDLRAAHDALEDEVRRAHRKANPFYVELEPEQPKRDDAAAKLRARLREAEEKAQHPEGMVSKDGRLQVVLLRTTFPDSETEKGRLLVARLDRLIAATLAEAGPGVDAGLTGDIITGIAEHDTLLRGMLTAVLLTVALCLVGLYLYYRTARGLLALFWSLGVGSVLTFAVALATVGHLNLATAFLSSIVVGNGINFGIILLARHLEERRQGRVGIDALAWALASTWRGTLAAALTACVSYASLIATDFRGFRHFGVIAGVGIVLCWLTAYTVLPAALMVLERHGWLKARPEPPVGRVLDRLLPRRLHVVAGAGAIVTVAAAVATVWFLTHDPYESNFKNLRSQSSAITEARRWMKRVDAAFGEGISGGFVIAVPTRADGVALCRRLRSLDAGKDEQHRLFHTVACLDDAIPKDQEQKLELLGEIRRLLSDKTLAELDPADRADAVKLKPPADLRALTDADVPEALAWPFTEWDGTRGRLVLATPGFGYEIWNSNDLLRFSETVRRLGLGEGTLLGGSTFVLADVTYSMRRDGPRATVLAFVGALLVVALLVGVNRHGLVTIACCASGTLLMLATAWLLGLKVNFLDFVALPITIGLGIDYSVNIVTRARQEGADGGRRALATTGAAVFLCSYTTIVGYGSLLLSPNRGIRSFGEAAILGEITCLAIALALAPALLHLLVERRAAAARAERQDELA